MWEIYFYKEVCSFVYWSSYIMFDYVSAYVCICICAVYVLRYTTILTNILHFPIKETVLRGVIANVQYFTIIINEYKPLEGIFKSKLIFFFGFFFYSNINSAFFRITSLWQFSLFSLFKIGTHKAILFYAWTEVCHQIIGGWELQIMWNLLKNVWYPRRSMF